MKRNDETPETLAQLWQQKAAGCPEARARLIERYHPLVSLTRQRLVPNVPLRISEADLEGEGGVALVRAVDAFDPARGVRFPSYAIAMMRGAMLEYLRRDDWVPRSVRTKHKRVNAVTAAVEARYGPEGVTDARLAQAAGLDVDAWYALCAEADILQVMSLEETILDDEPDNPAPLYLAETVRSREPDPSEEAAVTLEREVLDRYIGWLPEQERRVIQHYYFDGMRFEHVAARIGRSGSRVHQIHAQAIERLRSFYQGEPQPATVQPWEERAERWLADNGVDLTRRVPLTIHRQIAEALGVKVKTAGCYISAIRVARGMRLGEAAAA